MRAVSSAAASGVVFWLARGEAGRDRIGGVHLAQAGRERALQAALVQHQPGPGRRPAPRAAPPRPPPHRPSAAPGAGARSSPPRPGAGRRRRGGRRAPPAGRARAGPDRSAGRRAALRRRARSTLLAGRPASGRKLPDAARLLRTAAALLVLVHAWSLRGMRPTQAGLAATVPVPRGSIPTTGIVVSTARDRARRCRPRDLRGGRDQRLTGQRSAEGSSPMDIVLGQWGLLVAALVALLAPRPRRVPARRRGDLPAPRRLAVGLLARRRPRLHRRRGRHGRTGGGRRVRRRLPDRAQPVGRQRVRLRPAVRGLRDPVGAADAGALLGRDRGARDAGGVHRRRRRPARRGRTG